MLNLGSSSKKSFGSSEPSVGVTPPVKPLSDLVAMDVEPMFNLSSMEESVDLGRMKLHQVAVQFVILCYLLHIYLTAAHYGLL